MIDDTNTSLMFYPSNKQLSIGDKNVSGINIATQGESFANNCIKIGSSTSYINIKGPMNIQVVKPVNTTAYDFQDKSAFCIYDTGMAMKMGIYRDTGNAYIQVEQGNIGVKSLCLQTQETSQYVGIGTTAPAYKLDVNGNVRIGNWITNSNQIGTQSNPNHYAIYQDAACTLINHQSGFIGFRINNYEYWRITSSGNLCKTGYGTELPGINFNNDGTGLNWGTGNSRIVDNGHLQICTDDLMYFNTGCTSSSLGTTRMFINSDGNVGIGTTSPAFKLEVNGTAKINGKAEVQVANPNYSTASEGSFMITGGSEYSRATLYFRTPFQSTAPSKRAIISKGTAYSGAYTDNQAAGLHFCLQTNLANNDACDNTTEVSISDSRMMITPNGKVGIGVGTPGLTSPNYPLHIGTSMTGGNVTGKYWDQTIAPNTAYNSNSLASIYAAKDVISGAAFIVVSDRRIKTNIVDVEDDSALTMFRKLKPKTYEYVDKIQKGKESVYGFIAQEVQEVLPRATKMIIDFVPNIYKLCTVTGDRITIDPSKLEYDSSGNLFKTLKIIKEDNTEVFVQILNVDTNTIQIDQTLSEEKIFVFGQEVNNFYSLDKNAIWTVASAALQEVDRQLQSEKTKTQSLEEEVHNLKQNYVSLQQNYESLLLRILALESK